MIQKSSNRWGYTQRSFLVSGILLGRTYFHFLPMVPVGGTVGQQMDFFFSFSSSFSSLSFSFFCFFSFSSFSSSFFTPPTFQASPGSPVTSYSFSFYFLEHFCLENCPLLSGELSTDSRQSSDSYFSSVDSSPGLDIKLAQIWLTNKSQPWAGYKTVSLLLCHSFLCLSKTDSTVNTVNIVN